VNLKQAFRDVQNEFSNFTLVSVWFFEKTRMASVWNEFGSVKKMRFGSDIVVIYYSCNSKYYSDSG